MEIKPIIVAYDSLDKGTDDCPGLDFFFTACAENIISILHDKHLKYNEINGDKLEQKAVNQMIDTLSNSPFIFIGYSHGTDDALLCKIQHNYDSVNDECIFDKSEKYVSTNNLHKFENSFFYTWSCFSGK